MCIVIATLYDKFLFILYIRYEMLHSVSIQEISFLFVFADLLLYTVYSLYLFIGTVSS